MQQIDALLQENGTDAEAIGAQHGLSGDQVKQAMASLMPFVMGGFQKKAEAGEHEEVANLASGIGDPASAVSGGNDILGSIFGSKDVSREVASRAGGQSGIPAGVMKALLPVVAAMVAKRFMGGGAGGGLGGAMGGGLGGSILGSVLSGLGGNGQQLPGGGMMPAGGAASPGGGGLAGALGGMLDRNGDGNPLDDILGGLMGRR